MDDALKQLENQVAELAELCGSLYDENRSLKNEQRVADKERVQLKEKNSIARTRVERIVERLKGLDSEQA